MIRIAVTSLYVDDQDEALRFYTDVLGFVKKNDILAGDGRWLTVASPDGPEGVELLLEPNGNPVARSYQRAMFEAGVPATLFAVDDLPAEYERMRGLGAVFPVEPTREGLVLQAVLDDTCGNLVLLAQVD
ncbi:VOC family protein [Streptoalloteichus hindustanus]|uniref:Catechol 2,3-dioxygenase n=1 Tax=Streptoalloteichus hindustanus TaxID=2017 RepID=A0A1M5EM49_STRHI|nr:Catechol 2,3-dioxygenase [Streptoalloteichus hindustanus]